MEKNMYEEALELLEELEKDPQRQEACNCNLYIINALREELRSFQTGDYKVYSIYPCEHYFVDCFFPKTKEDKKLETIFFKIYKESRKKKNNYSLAINFMLLAGINLKFRYA